MKLKPAFIYRLLHQLLHTHLYHLFVQVGNKSPQFLHRFDLPILLLFHLQEGFLQLLLQLEELQYILFRLFHNRYRHNNSYLVVSFTITVCVLGGTVAILASFYFIKLALNSSAFFRPAL